MRTRKPEHEHHSFSAIETSGSGTSQLFLVGGGKRAYLWTGPANPRGGFRECVHTFGGEKSLRELAKAILREVGDA